MKSKKIPNHEAKSGEVQKLRKRIKRLENENARLKSEVKTLERFVRETSDYVDGKLDGVPVREVIKGVEKKMKLKDIQKDELKEVCPKCLNIELKSVPYRAGRVLVCSNCEFRKTVKEDNEKK